jgi:hypothetical protein
MKRLFSSLLIATSMISVGHAATIVWGAGQDNGFSLQNGSNLGIGNLARVGTFNVSDAVIAANAGNISFLNSHFTEFGNARIGDNFGVAEHFSMNSVANSGPAGLNIEGAQIYYWVFASTDNSSVANSISTAFQLGIFYFDKALDGDWAVPTQVPPGPTATTDISDLTTGSALTTGAHVVVGSFPDGNSDQGPAFAPNFGLAIVPEPSAAVAMVASVGLLALRRRRRA